MWDSWGPQADQWGQSPPPPPAPVAIRRPPQPPKPPATIIVVPMPPPPPKPPATNQVDKKKRKAKRKRKYEEPTLPTLACSLDISTLPQSILEVDETGCYDGVRFCVNMYRIETALLMSTLMSAHLGPLPATCTMLVGGSLNWLRWDLDQMTDIEFHGIDLIDDRDECVPSRLAQYQADLKTSAHDKEAIFKRWLQGLSDDRENKTLACFSSELHA